MKAHLLLSVLLLMIVAACKPNPSTVRSLASACGQHCDEIDDLLRTIAGLSDEARAAQRAGQTDDAVRLLTQYNEETARLSSILDELDPAPVPPAQRAVNILDDVGYSSDDLQRLIDWSEQTYEGTKFYGEMICLYRKAFLSDVDNEALPTLAPGVQLESMAKFFVRYTDDQRIQLQQGMEQNNIDPWDSSFDLFCAWVDLSDLH